MFIHLSHRDGKRGGNVTAFRQALRNFMANGAVKMSWPATRRTSYREGGVRGFSILFADVIM